MRLQTGADVLVAAAWLHDIGYSPDLVDTGSHSLDGGRWLRREHFDERIAALVAHHSCAWMEAEERRLDAALADEFPREESAVFDALCFADMTTGPDGQDFEVLERLAEIRPRYGPDTSSHASSFERNPRWLRPCSAPSRGSLAGFLSRTSDDSSLVVNVPPRGSARKQRENCWRTSPLEYSMTWPGSE